MYHLLTGLYAQFTRKDEYSIVIIGLDNVSVAEKKNPQKRISPIS